MKGWKKWKQRNCLLCLVESIPLSSDLYHILYEEEQDDTIEVDMEEEDGWKNKEEMKNRQKKGSKILKGNNK